MKMWDTRYRLHQFILCTMMFSVGGKGSWQVHSLGPVGANYRFTPCSTMLLLILPTLYLMNPLQRARSWSEAKRAVGARPQFWTSWSMRTYGERMGAGILQIDDHRGQQKGINTTILSLATQSTIYFVSSTNFYYVLSIVAIKGFIKTLLDLTFFW